MIAHAAALLVVPIILVGVVNRTKSCWAGRKGVPLLQAFYDIVRLARKRPVYSSVATVFVKAAPSVVLGTAVVSGLLVPLLGRRTPLSFPFDFVFFAYTWGLGRIFLMLGALDTGSSFEGMGASREATYSALVEPAFFLAAGTLAAASGKSSFAQLLRFRPDDPATAVVWCGCLVALFVLLQVESARIPVDDPSTHLELTMIHEVMVLDHSGPDLAVIQYASAIKMTVCAGLLAALLNPLDAAAGPALFAAANLGLILGAGIVIGTVESLIARLKLRSIPEYIFLAISAAFVALLASTLRRGGLG
ncbi:MAG: hydrogenase [Elusimicrobia bacterium]|nr:hydrogenase [Elusimicrobiota bacterium]